MSAARLWAKSWDEARNGPPPDNVFLPHHLLDAYSAAVRVMDATGDDQLCAVGLKPDVWRDRARQIVLLAAALHDLGKANDHFQDMIAKRRDVRLNPQGLRHEWVSLLILQKLRCWLLPVVAGVEDDFALVEWAVAGHHPGHNHESPPQACPAGAGSEMRLLTDCADFHTALDNLRSPFNLDTPMPEISAERLALVGADDAFSAISAWFRRARRNWERLRRTEHRLLAAVTRNCLIASDVAGSALPKLIQNRNDIWAWITDSFLSRPADGDLQAIVNLRLGAAKPRDFQNLVASSRERITFVKAGCGSGKTLAAYMWAAKNYATRRLYFCYPTTGTATEGFKDYLFAPEADDALENADSERVRNLRARLFHSRRDVDFEIILSSGSDVEHCELDAVRRLGSLEAWSTPVVACTVDSVLGLIQNNKRGLFAWPALAQSAFVFDEIHAYDNRLFGALLRFLGDLPGLPALLMTASLPASKINALRRLVESRHQVWKPISGPESLEAMPRYHKAAISGNDPLSLIGKELAAGGKVLWVCNTVDRVMNAAVHASAYSPLIYHSRFKYEDRVERHKAVVRAFTPEHRPRVLAICSQVAEMSLDLQGCTMLVTDMAPVPALIQRFGRLNRQAKTGDSTRPFVIVEPGTHLPYSEPELSQARKWLGRLPHRQISQRLLADSWEESDIEPSTAVSSAWLDGGPSTTVSELREISPGITVVLEHDLSRLRRNPKDLLRIAIPMPPGASVWKTWQRFRTIPVCPDDLINYDPQRGAKWRK